MKIALNATAFLPGQMGGMETYFRNLFQALQDVDKNNDYALLCDTNYMKELPIFNLNFKTVACNYTKPSCMWFLRSVIRHTTGIDILRPIINRLRVDVIHHPFSFLNPLHYTIPSVLTFHDMQHEFFPEYFSSYEMKVRGEFYRPSAEQATRIIAISEHVKMCLVKKYEIVPDKIDVVYFGYDPRHRIVEDLEAKENLRLRYGLHKPFMYYPAATWPHKNHKRLLAALKLMKEEHRFDGQLVLSGIAMQKNNKVLEKIKQLGLHDDVTVLGYVPYDDLPYLYNLARMMVFPSLFEGFGFPLIEAMACGCPIACSNVTSLPEVVGDAGVTFDPDCVEEITQKVMLLWNDDALRKRLAIRGVERATLFTWDKSAHQTIETYKKAAGN